MKRASWRREASSFRFAPTVTDWCKAGDGDNARMPVIGCQWKSFVRRKSMSLLLLSDAHVCDYRTESHWCHMRPVPQMPTDRCYRKDRGGGWGLRFCFCFLLRVRRLTREGGYPARSVFARFRGATSTVGVSPTQARATRNRWRTREQGTHRSASFRGRCRRLLQRLRGFPARPMHHPGRKHSCPRGMRH